MFRDMYAFVYVMLLLPRFIMLCDILEHVWHPNGVNMYYILREIKCFESIKNLEVVL